MEGPSARFLLGVEAAGSNPVRAGSVGVGPRAECVYGRPVSPMPEPDDSCPGFMSAPGRCWRMLYDRNLQATHCCEAPSWTGRWFSPKGERWWRVWACPDHLEGLTGLREYGRPTAISPDLVRTDCICVQAHVACPRRGLRRGKSDEIGATHEASHHHGWRGICRSTHGDHAGGRPLDRSCCADPAVVPICPGDDVTAVSGTYHNLTITGSD